MHILDFIMYFVTSGILWFIMDKLSGGEMTQEIGGLIGATIMIIYTILYVIIFCFYPDLNWIDIFNGKYAVDIHEWFKL